VCCCCWRGIAGWVIAIAVAAAVGYCCACVAAIGCAAAAGGIGTICRGMLHVAAAGAAVVVGVAAGTAAISVYADMAVQRCFRTEALHSAQAGIGKISV